MTYKHIFCNHFEKKVKKNIYINIDILIFKKNKKFIS